MRLSIRLLFLLLFLPPISLHATQREKYTTPETPVIKQFKNRDVIVFGETHGTNEYPLAFLKILKEYIFKSKEKVLVAIEIPPSSIEDARTSLLKCKSIDSCRKSIAPSLFWKNSRDGRSSTAYFSLINELVHLEVAGKINLISADYRKTGLEKFGIIASEKLTAELNKSKRKLFVLTGNSHAVQDGSPNSLASAFVDKGFKVTSLLFATSGGDAWVCSGGICGVLPIPGNSSCHNDNKTITEISNNGSVIYYCVGRISNSPPLLQ